MRENARGGKIPAHNFITANKSPPPPPPPAPLVQDLFGAYIMLNYKKKYKNILNTHLYMKGKMVKWKKWVNRKSKWAKIKMQEAFSQARRISQLAKFPAGSNFLTFSALLSFWFLICNAEFDLNSSCLDRLNNFGINSLQKLQN